MTLQELREKRTQLVADMEAVLQSAEDEGRVDLDETEEELYQGYKQELDTVKAAIERREALGAEKDQLSHVSQPAASRGQGVIRVPGPEAKQEFENLGEFMYAVHFNRNDQRLEWHQEIGADQSTADGASGGFAIPTQFQPGIMSVDPQEAIIRPRAQVIPAGSPPDAPLVMTALDQTGDTPHNRYGGVEVNWTAEGGTKQSTETALREITLQPHEISAHIPVTDRLLANWTAASSFLEQQLRGALAAATDDAFLSGDGAGKPLGVYTSAAAFTVNRDTNNEIAYVDLVNMLARLHGTGVFVAAKATLPQLMQIQDPNGNYIWQPNAREGEPQTLFGRPLLFNERNPGLGSKGDISLMDLSFYLIKDGSGPFVATGFSNDDFIRNKTRIKIFFNVDGQPWLTQPFKEENGYEVSPFVVLDA